MDRMPLRAHLEELQRRVKISLIYFSAGLAVAFLCRHRLMDIVKAPHVWAMEKMNLASTVYVFRYQDHFITQLKVCLAGGFILAFPFILYHFLKFIGPGLLPGEKRMVFRVYLPVFLLLFLAGGLFSYFLLIPYGLHFLSLFGTEAGLFPLISFSDYVSLFVMLILMCALTFELPLLMILLSRLGVISAELFRRKRRHAILVSFIVAAILTPPDPFTQIFLAIPLVLLYEIGVWSAMFTEKRRRSTATLPLPL